MSLIRTLFGQAEECRVRCNIRQPLSHLFLNEALGEQRKRLENHKDIPSAYSENLQPCGILN